jgi:hypothetical protein
VSKQSADHRAATPSTNSISFDLPLGSECIDDSYSTVKETAAGFFKVSPTAPGYSWTS